MNSHTSPSNSLIGRFLQLESSGGILLVVAATLAMLMANTPLASLYNLLIDIPVAFKFGALEIAKPLLLWVNDGLMAVFFLMVGLELKREVLTGELSNPKTIVLPALGALGGMFVPAAIYLFFNQNDAAAMNGWAIPAATDIAFALGILSLLGSRVPTSLKIFLTSLAIFDDIGAIIIIAFFYTSHISALALSIALACMLVLFTMNRRGVMQISMYLFIGLIMWVSLLKSGVHATLAGVVLAMFIPMKNTAKDSDSLLLMLERDLHVPVAYFILPIFAFCNAGLTFTGLSMEQVTHPIPMGIALGLFLGKQIGVFSFCWLGIKLKLADKPASMSWSSLYSIAILCGIGFTMSLFVGSLAFQETGVNNIVDERLGIILGSLASGLLGYLALRFSLPKSPPESK